MFALFAEGFFLQASLILALGAQNIFVLNSGLRRQRHLLVATICSVCDTILIFIGVLGVASFFVQLPILKITLGVIGVAFLFFYGILKLREAKNGSALANSSLHASTVRQTILTTLGFTLLNPHVYLDTMVLIGGYSAQFSLAQDRFYFGSGASFFSIIWFFALATLSSAASRLLNSPKAMRIVSLLSGLILVGLALKLGYDVLAWIMITHNMMA